MHCFVCGHVTTLEELSEFGAFNSFIYVNRNYVLFSFSSSLNFPTFTVSFILTTSKVAQSWAGIMDVNSLRTIPAPRFPGDTVELPPKSILLATYLMETPHRPKKVKRYLTIYPQDSRTIMVPITRTTFEINVDLAMPASVLDEKYTGTLQVGALGLAANASWTIVLDCYHNGTVLVSSNLWWNFTMCVCCG